jgi:hypothetical protein
VTLPWHPPDPPDRIARRLIERAGSLLAMAALFALAWRYMDLLGDSFWSVATGRWILEHGRLPTTDPFSFTANRAWIVHMPLSQLAFAWVASAFGMLGLELVGTLVFTLALLILWLPHARSLTARLCTWPLLLGWVLVQANDLCVRGQLFGDLGFAVLLLLVFRLRDGQRVHPLLGLLLGACWINLHASVFLLVVVPLGWAAALVLLPPKSRPPLAPYSWLAASGALGMLINPYHFRLVGDLGRLLSSPATRSIDLFRPPDFGSPGTWLAIAVMVTAAWWCAKSRDAAGGVPEALLLLLWLVAAATGRRYLPLGFGMAIAVIGRLATARWPASAEWHRPAQLALGVTSAGVAFWGLGTDKDPWRDVPLVEARLVEARALPDRVANLYHWGGYLDYAWNGRRKVFVDGRNQLFENGAFEAASQLGRLENWQAILDRYGINTVLWERGSALDAALLVSGEWLEVHRGRIAVLYVRRRPRPSPT